MELLSNKIREHRFRNDEMTQKVLAERVSISRQTMNAIENCRHAPTVSVAIRIADVFSVTVDQLFSLDYEGKPAYPEQPARANVSPSRVLVEEPLTAAVGLSRVPIDEPVDTKSRPEPVKEEAVRQVTLADLRGVIG